jgi:hypothetical protein
MANPTQALSSGERFPMLTGARFKLEQDTLAFDAESRVHKSVTIPTGAIITVVSDGEQMVDVAWEGRTVEMFAVDLNVRGTEITGH